MLPCCPGVPRQLRPLCNVTTAPLSSAAPAWGLRRGPSSSEPYRPWSSPPAQMLSQAEHSPLGSQSFRSTTPTGEWADRRAGPLSVHQAHLEPASSSLFAAAFLMLLLMGWGGGTGLLFYTLSGVDWRDARLFPLIFFLWQILNLQNEPPWGWGFLCFLSEFTLDPSFL